jgi:glyoxylase-like metal-dependent hydrolase (beta-lactamase superfamily II)
MKAISSGPLHSSYPLGGMILTSLRDGFVDMPVSRLRQPGDRLLGETLPADLPLFDGQLRLSVNAFAIDDGDEVLLIDTGAANAWHPSMGRLPDALAEADIAPERVRMVAFTHTHIDHIQGLVLPDGSDAFPQLSRLLVPRAELAMFRDEARLARFHDLAEPFDPGQNLKPGVEAVNAVGHEIGHSAFRVSGRSHTVLIWGDTVHVPSLQFDRPDVTWELDADQDQARQTRMTLLAQAAEENLLVAGAHLDWPGIGRVLRKADTYAFQPV